MEESFLNWLAGFIDGEGCFQIKPKKRQSRVTLVFACDFTLKLRSDDAAILHEIARRTKIGVVSYYNRGGGRRKGVCTWSVQKKSDCLRLIEILDSHPLRAKKRKDYDLWKQAVLIWTLPEGARDWMRISNLRDQLREGRKFLDPPVVS